LFKTATAKFVHCCGFFRSRKLKTGRGNLITQADNLKQLGARNSKQLPAD
jgi:hypothetical protein